MDYKLGCSQSQNSLSVRARVSQSSLSMLESAQNTASAASRLIMVLFLWKWPRVLAKDEVGVCGMEAVSVQQLHGYQFLMKVAQAETTHDPCSFFGVYMLCVIWITMVKAWYRHEQLSVLQSCWGTRQQLIGQK